MSSTTKINVPDIFASMVFNDDVMRERLPKDVYKSLRKTIDDGKDLDITVANAVANAMKDWAIEKGATHYTHWFQPMTGITAEKHDSFISPTADGRIIMEFSGKELIKGEPDASSFPSGGLRATFEARGYTAWDPTSYAFIKDHSLYIPTAFCSYGGEVLDKKTPLLRSMEALSAQAVRILRLFGDSTTKRVITTVGPEQEYFLVDKKLYDERPDLIYTGRTLFGARAPKGQELEDHYFGAIKPRIAAFMQELDEELWKLGVLAKTKHNEVAPAQHELAPIFSTTNVATDHNQLTMETMKNVALRHGLVCLLHEKPFAGVNGSGKHNNWSISTDTGKNLLEPGKLPQENAQFLLFLAAVIKGVDEYQDLLRISVASAGNDHRLGANEAPPAIISIFLGDELTAILHAIETGTVYGGTLRVNMEIGVNVLPSFTKDTTDRNRTSPFAFTGNKFEFRSLGSQLNIACPNIMLNTIIADELEQFADELEGKEDFNGALNALIKRVIKEHKRIIFNGDGYADAWKAEAAKRGLTNLPTTVDALPHYTDEKNVKLFTKHKIYTEVEMQSRQDIILETYAKTINIEALTASDMVKRDILPAVSSYVAELASGVATKKAISDDIPCEAELDIIKRLSGLQDCAYKKLAALDNAIIGVKEVGEDPIEVATYYKDSVITAMTELRAVVDEMETLVSSDYWPYPSYGDLMFRV
ncbi:MAG: glutamine synthetase III [Firmicutes bacterium]|uniref:glutamine synthetase III family protein n=1 Tax=Oscillospiraceae TaxID=216572 RepID=UPI0029312504|nr:glutamine synthetase III [Ruminococcus bromii]MDD6329356.1 glutamine synthetase III [Bacillota bacterium]MDY4107875.1 glutamine synthetase III [Oscillospiraceae bacterium]MDD7400651.1 glutamine synthetase III [Bacillota bacterium]MDD7633320.1 glutamine synthetase III [Bacillota bacterium]MDE8725702.1 glutamine synthetase III [Ruminococcus bromii]